MDNEIEKMIEQNFSESVVMRAKEILNTITTKNVTAHSKENQRNTQIAVIKLASGSIEKLSHYVECAQKDFRDVIYWSTEND